MSYPKRLWLSNKLIKLAMSLTPGRTVIYNTTIPPGVVPLRGRGALVSGCNVATL